MQSTDQFASLPVFVKYGVYTPREGMFNGSFFRELKTHVESAGGYHWCSVPIAVGDYLAVHIENLSDDYWAVPIYVGGANIWAGGPSKPGDCSVSHMWGIAPGDSIVAHSFMDPRSPMGHPFIIVDADSGEGVSKVLFDGEHTGEIAVYARKQYAVPRGSFGGSFLKGGVCVGAGREEYVGHRTSGVQYEQRSAQISLAKLVPYTKYFTNSEDRFKTPPRSNRSAVAPRLPLVKPHDPFRRR